MADNKWKRIESKVWKPENKGDSLEGVLIAKEPKTADIGAKYTIENKGGAFLVWGTAVLDDRMNQVKVGQELRITFDGVKKLEGAKTLNLFEVDVAKTKQELEAETPVDDTAKKTANADKSPEQTVEEETINDEA